MLNEHKMITIPRAEYKALKRDMLFLNLLIQCGVESWDGYNQASDMLNVGEYDGGKWKE